MTNERRAERQNAIVEIITRSDVESQHQLLKELSNIGIHSTQSTLSRDIKDLNLIKEMTISGGYKYILNEQPDAISRASRLRAIFRESVTSCKNAMNIVVIKTLPGLAPAACGAMDKMGIKDLVGSIAGDDTGFLAMSDIETAERFRDDIIEMLK